MTAPAGVLQGEAGTCPADTVTRVFSQGLHSSFRITLQRCFWVLCRSQLEDMMFQLPQSAAQWQVDLHTTGVCETGLGQHPRRSRVGGKSISVERGNSQPASIFNNALNGFGGITLVPMGPPDPIAHVRRFTQAAQPDGAD